MQKTRIELHLTAEEVAVLDKIAEQQSRSRKNLCETEIRKLVKAHLEQQPKTNNND